MLFTFPFFFYRARLRFHTYSIKLIERADGSLGRAYFGSRLLCPPQLRRPYSQRLAVSQRVHVLSQPAGVRLPARRQGRVAANASDHIVFALTVLGEENK